MERRSTQLEYLLPEVSGGLNKVLKLTIQTAPWTSRLQTQFHSQPLVYFNILWGTRQSSVCCNRKANKNKQEKNTLRCCTEACIQQHDSKHTFINAEGGEKFLVLLTEKDKEKSHLSLLPKGTWLLEHRHNYCFCGKVQFHKKMCWKCFNLLSAKHGKACGYYEKLLEYKHVMCMDCLDLHPFVTAVIFENKKAVF